MDDSSYENQEEREQGFPQEEESQEARLATAMRNTLQGGEALRPSRESILQSYAAQDAARARNARIYSQAASQAYKESSQRARERQAQRAELDKRLREQEERRAESYRYDEAVDRLRAGEDDRRQQGDRQGRQSEDRQSQQSEDRQGRQFGQTQSRPHYDQRARTRVVPPLSSQESYDRTRSSQASYERARAMRDALSNMQQGRTTNRDIIDARGSIDSRAFDETHELVGYSIDEQDRPDAKVEASFSETDKHWRSRGNQDSVAAPVESHHAHRYRRSSRDANVGSSRISNSMVGGNASSMNPRSARHTTVPLFVRIAVPVIIVLAIVLVVLLVR